jgi:aryl-alcohol dehydrogenase-like predicted oxidoreductase/histidinol phosphatase-like enzyme
VIGLGCMRLSTTTVADAPAVIAAAIAAGVELFDTADVYCRDDSDLGANESLLAPFARSHRVVTKGGLTRPGGAWVPDGRARHLAAAARASRDRLGVIALYLLHAVDPKVGIATSVRALAKLREDGVIGSIGLANVTPTQLEQALAIAPIAAVEVELHPWKLDAIRGGLLARCAERGIEVLAHRPLGGTAGAKRAARDPVVKAIAERFAATPHQILLAWLRSLSPVITPLPGATTIATATSAIRGQQLVLDDDARAALAAHFLDIARSSRRDRSSTDARAARAPLDEARPPSSAASKTTVGERTGDADAEVVVILGMPAAGKSTLSEAYVARGYARLNRDDRGGSLLDLARALDDQLADQPGVPVVVDNTYATRASRAPVIEVARSHGIAVRCISVVTTIEQAQAHAARRVLERCGSFDATAVANEIRPGVQFRYRRDFEPPALDEGFAAIEEVAPPRVSQGRHAGIIVELDGVVWLAKPSRPDQIELRPGVREALASWPVVGATLWRPGISLETVTAIASRLAELLERAIDVRACPHPAGPPTCWCRKPMPGLAIALARDHDLSPTRTIVVGRGPADRGFALRAGMPYVAIEDGWPALDQSETEVHRG